MGKRLIIKRHLSIEALEKRYRGARDRTERSHYQIIWLLAKGESSATVAEMTGYNREWVRELARRYNRLGAAGISDGRAKNQGGKRLLSVEQEAALKVEVETDWSAGRHWTGPQLAHRMSELVGREIRPQRGWDLLKRWGYRLRQPRPRHARANPTEQATFKKF